MDVTPLIPAGRQFVQAYGDGGFRISGQRYEGGVLILPERTVPWPVGAVAELSTDSLALLQSDDVNVELLLIGCGKGMAFIDPALRASVRAWGIVIDAMDTGAACRTYNVLLSEERRVAAALLPVH